MKEKEVDSAKGLGGNSLRNWLILVALAIVWGSSFILIKTTLKAYTPIETGALRLGISGLILLVFAWKHITRVPMKRWRILLIVSLTGTGIPVFLFAYAQQHVASAVTALINTSVPVFTLLLGLLFFSAKSAWRAILGVVLGLIGTLTILITQNGGFELGQGEKYGFLVLLGSLFYACNINLVKRYLNRLDPILIAMSTFMFLSPIALVHLFFFSEVPSKIVGGGQAIQSLGAVVLLSGLGTVMAKILFFKLVQNTNAVFSSMVTYLIPIVALFWGLLDGERVYAIQMLGFATILFALSLVNQKAKN